MHKELTSSFLAISMLVAINAPAVAHHSVSTNYLSYDEGPVELTATITEVEIRNPHSLVTLEVIEEDGTVKEYLAEWSDGNALRRRGVAVDRLEVGEEVVVHARRHRRLDDVIYIRDIVMADGTMVRDCGANIYRGDEYYATCDEAEADGAPFIDGVFR